MNRAYVSMDAAESILNWQQTRIGSVHWSQRDLRRQTTFTIRQIAERLHLGSWKSFNNKLYLRSRGNGKPMK
jgi:hypothetical protein